MSIRNKVEQWDLDIDHYLNCVLPPSQLHRFPPWISHFLGYRKEQKQDVGNAVGAWWSLLGAFCGLAVIAAVFNNVEEIQRHNPPALIASFGASAILEYNAIRSPLGQPRNAMLGHGFSALVGVGITKLFRYHPEFERIRWIAGAVSCGVASAVMLLTGTVHPPGGASAVLAATEPNITEMGWYFVGLVMFGTTLMVMVGLVINNIQRQFPMYWWTPLDLRKARIGDEETMPDGHGGVEEKASLEQLDDRAHQIHISSFNVSLPVDIPLSPDEAGLLENLRVRLRRRLDEDLGRLPSRDPSTASNMAPVGIVRSDSSTLALQP